MTPSSSCHDSLCPSELPVKHWTILLSEAPVYLFKQDQGATGLLLTLREFMQNSFSVYSADWMIGISVSHVNLELTPLFRWGLDWSFHSCNFCSVCRCRQCSSTSEWPAGVAVRSLNEEAGWRKGVEGGHEAVIETVAFQYLTGSPFNSVIFEKAPFCGEIYWAVISPKIAPTHQNWKAL